MKLYCIASGSSGNCIFVEDKDSRVMFDAGVSAKRIEKGISDGGFELPQAIFITHEHSDHIQGLEVFLKHHPIPVFATKGTLYSIASGFKGHIPEELFNYITPGSRVRVGSLEITANSTSHDAADPLFYVVENENVKLGLATDLGCYTELTLNALRGSDLLYLESNYDPNMLMAGSYPYSLKQRINGARGHLSNDMAAELVTKLLEPNLKQIVLAHLSKENNYAELAHETMRQAVCNNWHFESEMPLVTVANRDIPSKVIKI